MIPRPGEIVVLNPRNASSYVRWPAVRNHEDTVSPCTRPLPKARDAVAIVLSAPAERRGFVESTIHSVTVMIYALSADSPSWQIRAAVVKT